MNKYTIEGVNIDSVELKCLLISRGICVDEAIYQHYKGIARLNKSPLCCNCLILSDGTIAQLTDVGSHLRFLSGMFDWDNTESKKLADDLATPFSLQMQNNAATLFYKNEEIDTITFPPATDFYKQKTTSGNPFIGNAVLQGVDWVAFQCLWACEYAATGDACEFCFSGADIEATTKKGKLLPSAFLATDVAEIVKYAIDNVNICSVQITGGSTFNGEREATHIIDYLKAINQLSTKPCGEILLYITPPTDLSLIDRYFSLGASRIACSVEVWDLVLAKKITPGKVNITGRKEHLQALEYIAQKYGHGKAFSNLIIGLESFETLKEGATFLAERGIMPSASIWMPMGKPVQGSMKAPDINYYRRVKELFAELYLKYNLEPTPCKGLNVCVERDIWSFATNSKI
jgi:hypothetical protein